MFVHNANSEHYSSMFGSAWTRTSLEDENNMEDYATHTKLLNMMYIPSGPTQNTQQN
jgi:hypothetical protein